MLFRKERNMKGQSMVRITKYQNDQIRNKAINILRSLSDKNKLTGDELALIGAFITIERAENTKLKQYENLEEQGLLLKLPCKRVWRIVDAKTKYAYVLGKAIDDLTISEIRGIDKKGYYYSTAEKAEKALADMRKKVQE